MAFSNVSDPKYRCEDVVLGFGDRNFSSSMVDDIRASNRFHIMRATTDIQVLNTTCTLGTKFEKSSARQANTRRADISVVPLNKQSGEVKRYR